MSRESFLHCLGLWIFLRDQVPNPNPDPVQDSEISILREELEAQGAKFRELEKSQEGLNEKISSLTNSLDNLRSEISEDHGVWVLKPPLRGPPGPQGLAASPDLDFPSYCTTAQLRFRASSTTHYITYPPTGEYGNYLDLCYIISAPVDERVVLNVTKIKTEADFDHLKVYKSEHGELTNLQNFTGDLGWLEEEGFTSNSGESILVYFHSDPTGTGKGFSFSFDTGNLAVEGKDLNETGFGNYLWEQEETTEDSVDNQFELDLDFDFSILGNITTQFRLRASEETQQISYPISGHYDNNVDLCYLISAPADERILLNVTRIKIEPGYDYLHLYKFANGVLTNLQNFTGNLGWLEEEQFTSNVGESILLYFHSDSVVTDDGFSFSFNTGDFPNNRRDHNDVEATLGAQLVFDYDMNNE